MQTLYTEIATFLHKGQLDVETCACVHTQSSIANLNLDPYMVSAELAVALGTQYQIVQEHYNFLYGCLYISACAFVNACVPESYVIREGISRRSFRSLATVFANNGTSLESLRVGYACALTLIKSEEMLKAQIQGP